MGGADVLAQAQRYHLLDLTGLARLVEGDVLLHGNEPTTTEAAELLRAGLLDLERMR